MGGLTTYNIGQNVSQKYREISYSAHSGKAGCIEDDPKTRHDSNGLRPKKTARWGDVHKAVHYQRRIVPRGRLGRGARRFYEIKDHKYTHKFTTDRWAGAEIRGRPVCAGIAAIMADVKMAAGRGGI